MMTLDEAILRAEMLYPEEQNLIFNGQEILDVLSMLRELKQFRDREGKVKQ